MDSFMEYMIAKQKTPMLTFKKIMIYITALMLGLFISMVFLIINPAMFISFIPITIAAVLYIAYRINCSFNVEFEYIFTNGELDIDKITHKRRRSRLLTVHCKAFTHFAKVGDGEYANEENSGFARIIDASAKSKMHDDYYAIFFLNGQKIKLIFNPTQKMIELFKLYSPRVIK